MAAAEAERWSMGTMMVGIGCGFLGSLAARRLGRRRGSAGVEAVVQYWREECLRRSLRRSLRLGVHDLWCWNGFWMVPGMVFGARSLVIGIVVGDHGPEK